MVNDWADRDQQLYSGNAIVGTAAAIAILQIFFVVARLGTRCMQRMKLRVDDYLVLLSLVCISIFTLTQFILIGLYIGCKFGKIDNLCHT
jgi:hypothetical protein